MLLPEERRLFPKELVVPCGGRGKSPKHKNFKIYAYQMTEKTCLHLENNRCSIYEDRPTKCRAYPFKWIPARAYARLIPVTPYEMITEIDPECSWAIEVKRKLPKDLDFTFERDSEEFKALTKILDKGMRMARSKKPYWGFDVVKQVWIKKKKSRSRV